MRQPFGPWATAYATGYRRVSLAGFESAELARARNSAGGNQVRFQQRLPSTACRHSTARVAACLIATKPSGADLCFRVPNGRSTSRETPATRLRSGILAGNLTDSIWR